MINRLNIHNHPCFNGEVKGKYGRVHLPVAPQCNIKCNYCNRRYDCVNESRPGVSSAVLSPARAVNYLEEVLAKAPEITVAGIAGPGDAFAEPERTLETLREVRKRFPDLLLCVASNGLNAVQYVDELEELSVSHVTITVNAVDPDFGALIYGWVRFGKKVYRKRQAAEMLLNRQLAAISALKRKGIVVKVNTIVVPGINDHHVVDVAKMMADLGVDIQNCMAMYPNADSPFSAIPEPSPKLMSEIQAKAGRIMPQMMHCTRCRADAVGLLGVDASAEYRGCLARNAEGAVSCAPDKPYVAVATLEGVLVNQHLGHAYKFQIWGKSDQGFELMEEREAPPVGDGDNRWLRLASTLGDCRAVLVSAIGAAPRRFLLQHNIVPVEMSGFIRQGLETVYQGGDIDSLKGRRKGIAKGGCCGAGEGCG
ncbi:MAG: radical SAM protein [Desulfomonilaceae bacterium]|nr:radical SAM protein [Desulfomonilaceae bacterium]